LSKQYLDKAGTAYFWSKIKAYVDDAAGTGGSSTQYRKRESTYTTVNANESTIPIGISSFSSNDILFVDINGISLVEGVNYTVSGTNIVLTTAITKIGTNVHFTALSIESTPSTNLDDILGNFATVETGTTASQFYSAGEFIILGNKLYMVLSDITAGSAFTVGTNILQTTVGDRIANLQYTAAELSPSTTVIGASNINTGFTNTGHELNVTLSKVGKICTMSGHMKTGSALNPTAYAAMFWIPEKYYSKHQIVFQAFKSGSGSTTFYMNDGTGSQWVRLQLQNGVAASTRYDFTVSYIALY